MKRSLIENEIESVYYITSWELDRKNSLSTRQYIYHKYVSKDGMMVEKWMDNYSIGAFFWGGGTIWTFHTLPMNELFTLEFQSKLVTINREA